MAKKKVKKKKPQKKEVPIGMPGFDITKQWYVLAVMALAFLLYANTLSHGYVLDDDLVCAKNRFVAKGMAGIGDIFTTSFHEGFTSKPDRNYRPMMMAAFAVEKQFFGESPGTHHLFNVLWYALGCGLIFLALRQMFKERSPLLAFGIALLYAAHPIHTEVVANIKGRDEIFLMLGMAGTVYSVLRYCRSQNSIWLGVGLAAYLFAALSKESGLAVLGLVPLTAYVFGGQKPNELLKTTGFFLIPVALYFLLYFNATGDNGQTLGIIDNSLYAASNLGERTATAIGMMGDYLWLLFFPANLSFDYTAFQVPIVDWTHWKPLLSLAVWAGLGGYAVWSLAKGGKSPAAYGILLALILFGMVSNVFFLTGVTMAERLAFSPSLGFCIAVGFLLYEYLTEKYEYIYYAILAVVVLLYGYKTFDRNKAWKSNETLFATGVDTAPNSSRTQTFYGRSIYLKTEDTTDPAEQKRLAEEALTYYDKALSIYPGFTECYHHKGDALRFLKRYEESIKAYEGAVATQPDYYLSQCNMGLSYMDMGNLDKAVEWIEAAHNNAPNREDLRNNYGVVLLKKRDEILSRASTQADTLLAIEYDKRYKALNGQ